MRIWMTCLLSCAVVSVATSLTMAANPFGGNLVVVRSGDDTYASTGDNAAPAYLDEYTFDGVLVQSIPMGDYSNTTTNQFTLEGGNGNAGFISRSYDGNYLVMTGYKAPVGSADVTGSSDPGTSAPFVRTIARIDLNANIDTSTSMGDVGTNELRSATTVDGSAFWTAGTGGSGQVRYATFGANTSIRISTSSSGLNTRVVNIFKDAAGVPQLYVGRGNGSVNAVTQAASPNPKLPTLANSGSTPTALTALKPSGGSAYDYLFVDDSTLYVTDDNSDATGGVQKWTRTGSTWSLAYVLQANLSYVPMRGLTGLKQENGRIMLFATDGNGRNLVRLVDNGPSSVWTTIVNLDSMPNFQFHDVVMPYLVPEPATVGLLALGGLFCLRRRRSC